MSGVTTLVVPLVVPLVVAAAVVLGGLALVSTRDPWTALPVLLDLLLAAGLLRLTATARWEAIASAALSVVIRRVAGLGLREGRRARRQHGAGGSVVCPRSAPTPP